MSFFHLPTCFPQILWLPGNWQQRQMEDVTPPYKWWRNDGCWPLTCSDRGIFNLYIKGSLFKDSVTIMGCWKWKNRSSAVMYSIIDSLCYNSKPVTQQNYRIKQAKPKKKWETREVYSTYWKCLAKCNINIEIWNEKCLSYEINFKTVIAIYMYYQKSDFENKWLPNVTWTEVDNKVRFFVTLLTDFMRL